MSREASADVGRRGSGGGGGVGGGGGGGGGQGGGGEEPGPGLAYMPFVVMEVEGFIYRTIKTSRLTK